MRTFALCVDLARFPGLQRKLLFVLLSLKRGNPPAKQKENCLPRGLRLTPTDSVRLCPRPSPPPIRRSRSFRSIRYSSTTPAESCQPLAVGTGNPRHYGNTPDRSLDSYTLYVHIVPWDKGPADADFSDPVRPKPERVRDPQICSLTPPHDRKTNAGQSSAYGRLHL